MTTETPTDAVDVKDRLDAIIEQLDRIEEQLEENTQRTEISAKFITEIHGTWKGDGDSGKILKPNMHIKAKDRVSTNPLTDTNTKVGTVKWVSIDKFGNSIATVDWDDDEIPRSYYFTQLARITTPGPCSRIVKDGAFSS